jgi:hypothetical protein
VASILLSAACPRVNASRHRGTLYLPTDQSCVMPDAHADHGGLRRGDRIVDEQLLWQLRGRWDELELPSQGERARGCHHYPRPRCRPGAVDIHSPRLRLSGLHRCQ